jgi:hypothetical protein
MNQDEKDALVQSIVDDLKLSILSRIPKMPEDWDGHELRQFIADYYQANYIWGTQMTGKRRKDYKNTCLVDNLL